MKTDRLIARVKSMLERANSGEELARLTSLLVMLQTDRIAELERINANRRLEDKRKVA